MSRAIFGLVSAVACSRPSHIPQSRPRDKKAAGLRYERELAKALPRAKHGQWFRFTDRAGHGHCQPDLIIETEAGLAVLEAKYTWTEAGHRQIDRLYRPVLEKATGKLILGIVVCKVLTAETPTRWICRTLEAALARAGCGLPTVLHWIGSGLEPLRLPPSRSHLASSLADL